MPRERTGTLEWYVVHTFSGYENKVKYNLERAVANNAMQEWIHEVIVPTEDVTEIKDTKEGSKSVKVTRKTFPGYVLVHMIITDQSWYLVRNTRGVTGFVGPDSEPIALTNEELEHMLHVGSEEVQSKINVGDSVRILSGPLAGEFGTVEDIDAEHETLHVCMGLFGGRDMSVEFELSNVTRNDV